MAAHELFLLHLGQLGVYDSVLGRAVYNPVPGYVIRTATGRMVLVDTGNPRALVGRESTEPWDDLLTITRPEDDVVHRLGELGLGPGDIDVLVSTHFDFDHCGRHDAFAKVGIESIVQRRHLESVPSDPERFDPGLWDLPGIRYAAVDGDVELEPGLRLISSSGHAIGHQSLLVETGDGPVLLTIDAISREHMLRTREIPEWFPDVAEAERSMDRLVALAEETEAYLLFGHYARQWDTLPKSPEPFRRPR